MVGDQSRMFVGESLFERVASALMAKVMEAEILDGEIPADAGDGGARRVIVSAEDVSVLVAAGRTLFVDQDEAVEDRDGQQK